MVTLTVKISQLQCWCLVFAGKNY